MYRILHGKSNCPPKREGSIGLVALHCAFEAGQLLLLEFFTFSVSLALVCLP